MAKHGRIIPTSEQHCDIFFKAKTTTNSSRSVTVSPTNISSSKETFWVPILRFYFLTVPRSAISQSHFGLPFVISQTFSREREREEREDVSGAPTSTQQLRKTEIFVFKHHLQQKNKKERASGLIFDEGEREREDGQRLQSTSSANVSDRLQPGYPLPLPNQTNVLRREKESTDAGDASSSKYIFSERLQSSKQNKHHHLTIFATEKFKTKTKTKTILQFTQTYHHNNLTIQR